MSGIVEKMRNSKVWYWSLRPGTFIDHISGKKNPDLISIGWKGTMSEWNAGLVQLCLMMGVDISVNLSKDDILYLPKSLEARVKPIISEKWPGKIMTDEILSFDTILIESKDSGTCGMIKILNISEKGNIV